MRSNHPEKIQRLIPQTPLWGILLLRLEGTHLRTQGGVFDGGHYALLRVKAKLLSATRDRKGLLEVFKRLPQAENLVCKRFLSRDGNLGSVLTPQISLIEAVKLLVCTYCTPRTKFPVLGAGCK